MGRGEGQRDSAVFMDGTGITPGTERCKCGNRCEFPCWQRIGLTDQGCSECGCPDLAEVKPEGGTEAIDQTTRGDRFQ